MKGDITGTDDSKQQVRDVNRRSYARHLKKVQDYKDRQQEYARNKNVGRKYFFMGNKK